MDFSIRLCPRTRFDKFPWISMFEIFFSFFLLSLVPSPNQIVPTISSYSSKKKVFDYYLLPLSPLLLLPSFSCNPSRTSLLSKYNIKSTRSKHPVAWYTPPSTVPPLCSFLPSFSCTYPLTTHIHPSFKIKRIRIILRVKPINN